MVKNLKGCDPVFVDNS